MSSSGQYILPATYFGPVQYFSKLTSGKDIIIEQFENYNKQTYRNRCEIMAANGRLALSIPVKKIKGSKTKIKDIRIDYDTNWQKDHKRGLVSAYKSSPFYEFYIDEYLWVFNRRIEFLLDLNIRITEIILQQLQLKKNLVLSKEYQHFQGEPDLREIISPKRKISEDRLFQPVEYVQVFSDNLGFMPNLSVIDLIFNTGPASKKILKACYRGK